MKQFSPIVFIIFNFKVSICQNLKISNKVHSESMSVKYILTGFYIWITAVADLKDVKIIEYYKLKGQHRGWSINRLLAKYSRKHMKKKSE